MRISNLQEVTIQAIALLEHAVPQPPIPPIQRGTPYDDVWLALQSLRQALSTMVERE